MNLEDTIILSAASGELSQPQLAELLRPEVSQVFDTLALPDGWVCESDVCAELELMKAEAGSVSKLAKKLKMQLNPIYSALNEGHILTSSIHKAGFEFQTMYAKELEPDLLLEPSTLDTMIKWSEGAHLFDCRTTVSELIQSLKADAAKFRDSQQRIMNDEQVRDYIWNELGELYDYPSQLRLVELAGTQASHVSRMYTKDENGYAGPIPKAVLNAMSLVRFNVFRKITDA